MTEKAYSKNITKICGLLQTEPTPEVIQGLHEGFEDLSRQLRAGPFVEVFEATLSSIPFSALFSLLTAPDNRLITSVATVTGQLLKPVTWPMVHQTFEDHIVQGLAHPHHTVKTLVLNQFLKCEQSTEPFSPRYGPHIWKCLEGKGDNDVSRLARQVLVRLCGIGMALDNLLDDDSIVAVQELLDGDESQRFRAYDVVVAAARLSDATFERLREKEIIDRLLKEGSAKDVLVVMNYYELVPGLCKSAVALEHLQTAGVFTKALDLVRVTKAGTPAGGPLLQLAAIKLFTRMVDVCGASADGFLEKHPIASELAALATNPDTPANLRNSAVTSIGAIGSNPAALKHLSTEKTTLAALATTYSGASGELKIECLRAIACIFKHAAKSGGALSQTCFELYEQLDDGEFLGGLVKEIKKGLEESCIAGLSVIQNMASHAWGVREIATHESAVELLLKREPQRVKAVQQWQFATIQSIINAPQAKTEFDSDTLARLGKYVREGPFYVGAVPKVAVKTT
ncbi:hypothetical protein H4R18_000850 [Coemansia javaensis]|uniref:26S proteasome non-ATPase regulatory subunit 5 n=1 Tax=Coemansia javaensis TaxID=2761396 RepID=A0A9W8HH74_9FUNG|nr:hypothetical protein H4R18_000850 [Coemansia javaensis]